VAGPARTSKKGGAPFLKGQHSNEKDFDKKRCKSNGVGGGEKKVRLPKKTVRHVRHVRRKKRSGSKGYNWAKSCIEKPLNRPSRNQKKMNRRKDRERYRTKPGKGRGGNKVQRGLGAKRSQ